MKTVPRSTYNVIHSYRRNNVFCYCIDSSFRVVKQDKEQVSREFSLK